MTQRKPPGVSFETWIDRQIREAAERGEFDGLPGAGKPIPDIDRPYDEMWWIRQKMRREELSYLPPTLVLRKDAEDALEAASRAASEAAVRRIVGAINEKIREANRKPMPGPPLGLAPFDVDQVVREWRDERDRHGDPDVPPASPTPPEGSDGPTRRRRLPRWRRRRSPA